jgi:hypothetical protein
MLYLNDTHQEHKQKPEKSIAGFVSVPEANPTRVWCCPVKVTPTRWKVTCRKDVQLTNTQTKKQNAVLFLLIRTAIKHRPGWIETMLATGCTIGVEVPGRVAHFRSNPSSLSRVRGTLYWTFAVVCVANAMFLFVTEKQEGIHIALDGVYICEKDNQIAGPHTKQSFEFRPQTTQPVSYVYIDWNSGIISKFDTI